MMGWGWGSGMMGGFGSGFYGGYAGNGGAWWTGLIGLAVQLVFWFVIISLGVYAFRSLSSRDSRDARASRGRNLALDILQERYAKGEIDGEEYQRRKADLQ